MPQFIGKWDLLLDAVYDGARDFHFPGIGNEIIIDPTKSGYYRVNTREYRANVALVKRFARYHQFGMHLFYEGIKLLHDKNEKSFLSLFSPGNPIFTHKDYTGARVEYNFVRLDNIVLPQIGAVLATDAAFIHPFEKGRKEFFRFTGTLGGYIPIARNVTLVSKVVAATNTELTDFYQMNRLGGSGNFKGYLRFRFYGKSSFLNSNELQWKFPFRSYIMNGTAGIIGYFDNGRVWLPGEISNSWHTSYGGGVMLAPFDKIVVSGTYGITKEGNRINIRLGRML
jgi:hypothetical protein